MSNVNEKQTGGKNRPSGPTAVMIGAILLLVVIACLFLARSWWSRLGPPDETDIAQIPSASVQLVQPTSPEGTTLPLTPAESGATPPGGATPGMPTEGGPAASGTPCQPPPGWVPYEVQPGDTLFSLANATNTTIEAIMQANCMEDDRIVAYERIYLPSRPPRPPAQPAQPGQPGQPGGSNQPGPAPANPCDVPYACATPGAPLVLATGGGNEDPNFEPCKLPEQNPWLNIDDWDPSPGFQLQVGQRFYIHACDFPQDVVSAQVVFPGETTAREVMFSTTHLNPELKMYNSKAVIDFPALPTRPTGNYRITVKDESGKQASVDINVTLPDPNKTPPNRPPFILVVPASGYPGDSFQVYYVWFPMDTSPPFKLFGEALAEPGESHRLTERSTWQVLFYEPFVGAVAAGFGWATTSLSMPAELSPGIYAVSNEDQSVQNSFWLLRR